MRREEGEIRAELWEGRRKDTFHPIQQSETRGLQGTRERERERAAKRAETTTAAHRSPPILSLPLVSPSSLIPFK